MGAHYGLVRRRISRILAPSFASISRAYKSGYKRGLRAVGPDVLSTETSEQMCILRRGGFPR